MSEIITKVASRAASWSETACTLKDRLDKIRLITFGLSIAGALLATIASQTNITALAAASAASLAASAILARRFLGDVQTRAWIRARAGAEALTREAFKFATKADPYNDPAVAERNLEEKCSDIEKDLDDLVSIQVDPRGADIAPRRFIDPETYRKDRILSQIENYYKPKAKKYRKCASMLKSVEFSFALAAALLTSVASVIGGAEKGWFDLVAYTAVLTTISGIVLARLEACRYEYLVTSYFATARRLEDQSAHFDEAASDPARWSAFVNNCEKIIAEENASWIAKWTKPNNLEPA